MYLYKYEKFYNLYYIFNLIFIIYIIFLIGFLYFLINFGSFINNFLKGKNLTAIQKITSVLTGIILFLGSSLNYCYLYFILSLGYFLEDIFSSVFLLVVGAIILWLIFIIGFLLPFLFTLLPFISNNLKTYNFFICLFLTFIILPITNFIFFLTIPYILKPVNFVDKNKVVKILDSEPIKLYYKIFIFPTKSNEIQKKYESDDYLFFEQYPILTGDKNFEKLNFNKKP